MIRLAAKNGHGAVELFGEDEAYHLMGEGHRGERNLLTGAVVDLR